MAWTTPVDQATGFLVTSAIYNSQIIDNLKYLHGDAGLISLVSSLSTGPASNAIGGGGAGNEGVYVGAGSANPYVLLVGATSTSTALTAGISTDTVAWRFTVDHNGLLTWGTGALVADASLGRSSAGVLKISNALRTVRATPAYSASITPDASAGTYQQITVTNATPFTINAPSNPPPLGETQDLTIEVFNNTAGTIGAVTWAAAFQPLVGGQPTNYAQPAAGKKRSAHFRWNGAVWVVINSTVQDY